MQEQQQNHLSIFPFGSQRERSKKRNNSVITAVCLSVFAGEKTDSATSGEVLPENDSLLSKLKRKILG